MFINTEHPNSVRITPSKGDGGIDVLDPSADSGGGDIVYQVKRYAEALSSKQKTEVENSLKRLLGPDADPRWANLNVTTWRLVTPWGPTPEAYKWLQGLVAPYGVRVHWDGLTFFDRMAAKYPNVIDYYLHGNRTAMLEAQASVMVLMAGGEAPEGKVSAEYVMERVQKAVRVLDDDPHYRFEFRVGHGDPPEPQMRPGLVVSTWRIDTAAHTWFSVDVLARCAASLQVRPLTFEGLITAAQGSADADALKDFVEYGTPFISAAGGFSGQMDLPGGLGGPLEDATVKVSPVVGADVGDDPELRLEVLDASKESIAEVHTDRIEMTKGTVGIRVVLREIHGVFEQVRRFDLVNQQTHVTFTVLDIEGLPVSSVRPAVEFLEAFRAPNSARVSVRHSPAHLGAVEEIPAVGGSSFGSLARILRLLDALQQHTSTVVKVPTPDHINHQQAKWDFSARILRGEEVVVTTPEKTPVVDFELPAGSAPPEEGPITLAVPHQVSVGDLAIDLGRLHLHLDSPVLIGSAASESGRTVYRYTTSDQRVRYTLDHDNVTGHHS
ncbi:hypothetical protein [Isoptericola sp. G70]|uniref:hypothetical protein n=1 Tax=Isoptericola sp. G70 TaxID=3376633 RepID=UPI003A7FDC89